MTQRALLAGCAKNAAEQLGAVVLPNMLEIAALFEQSAICIYENDSTDNTAAVLESFPEVHLIQETNVQGSRTEVLARGRNKLLQAAREQYAHFDWLIMMDLDYWTPVALDGFLIALRSWDQLRWSACTANSRLYYDYWALRMPGFNRDCLRHPPQPTWVPTKRVTRVWSAFNGIGIYRMRSLCDTNCWYDGSETCEHVSFHRCLQRVVVHRDLRATTWDENHRLRGLGRRLLQALNMLPAICAALALFVARMVSMQT